MTFLSQCYLNRNGKRWQTCLTLCVQLNPPLPLILETAMQAYLGGRKLFSHLHFFPKVKRVVRSWPQKENRTYIRKCVLKVLQDYSLLLLSHMARYFILLQISIKILHFSTVETKGGFGDGKLVENITSNEQSSPPSPWAVFHQSAWVKALLTSNPGLSTCSATSLPLSHTEAPQGLFSEGPVVLMGSSCLLLLRKQRAFFFLVQLQLPECWGPVLETE